MRIVTPESYARTAGGVEQMSAVLGFFLGAAAGAIAGVVLGIIAAR